MLFVIKMTIVLKILFHLTLHENDNTSFYYLVTPIGEKNTSLIHRCIFHLIITLT